MMGFQGDFREHEDGPKTSGGIDKRAIKIAIYGFLFVLIASMIGMKPYLPTALLHNFADIDDYRIFHNRVVKAAPVGQSWKEGTPLPAPSAETQKLLDGLDTTALLMIENGEIRYEQYYDHVDVKGGKDEISGSFSMAKTIVSLLTGIALQEGSIRSLDEPISTYLPEWASDRPDELPQGKITIRNLLTMSSGLNWNESYSNPFSVTTEAYYGNNLTFTALRQRPIRYPGSMYDYQSGTTELLGLVVSRATNKNLAQYASEKLWIPMGAEKDALWSLDHEDGIEKAYCCFNARARDFARFGQLILNHGAWKDASGKENHLINSDYIKQMTTPNELPDEDGAKTSYYGYQTWILNTPQGDIPYARGILGQYIIVIPQKKRVIVRLGMKKGPCNDHHPIEVRALAEWGLAN